MEGIQICRCRENYQYSIVNKVPGVQAIMIVMTLGIATEGRKKGQDRRDQVRSGRDGDAAQKSLCPEIFSTCATTTALLYHYSVHHPQPHYPAGTYDVTGPTLTRTPQRHFAQGSTRGPHLHRRRYYVVRSPSIVCTSYHVPAASSSPFSFINHHVHLPLHPKLLSTPTPPRCDMAKRAFILPSSSTDHDAHHI